MHYPDYGSEIKNSVILIIDDNPANLKVLFDCLEMEGFEVLVAQSGKSGMDKAVYAQPDLVLLDIVMPEMNGFETCRCLKENEVTSRIPVIMITALADTEHKVEGFKYGAVDYITKPINIEEVLARITTHLKLKYLNENLEREIEKRTLELQQSYENLKQEMETRKKAQEELKQLQNFLENIVDSMPSMLVGVDGNGHVTHWNRAAEQVTNIKSDKVHGNSLPEAFIKFMGKSRRMLEMLDQKNIHIERKVLCEDNEKEQFSDITIYPLVSNGVEGAVIRVDDVTERVKIEEMMIQTEKMMTIGGLASGMAHEINNPVAGIIQCIQVVRNRLSLELNKNRIVAEQFNTSIDAIQNYLKEREITDLLESVLDSGKRIAAIVENMLSFSRKSNSSFIDAQIPELLDRTIDLAKSDYDIKKKTDFGRIEIIRNYDKNIPPVKCEPAKIQQVILNILHNAMQAMLDSDQSGFSPQIRLAVVNRKNEVVLKIKDNGPGMPPKVLDHIFEPFFTTKKAGEGTGLGLSISYFIITENHKGAMNVNSSPGEGAEFIIRLPMNSDTGKTFSS